MLEGNLGLMHFYCHSDPETFVSFRWHSQLKFNSKHNEQGNSTSLTLQEQMEIEMNASCETDIRYCH